MDTEEVVKGTRSSDILRRWEEIERYARTSKYELKQWIMHNRFPAYQTGQGYEWRSSKQAIDEWNLEMSQNGPTATSD